MRRRGRPLRFLVATLGGWTALRAGMLWPTIEAARDLVEALGPTAADAAEARPIRLAPIVRPPLARAPVPLRRAKVAVAVAVAVSPPAPGRRAPDPRRIALAAASFLSFGRAVPIEQAGALPPPLRPTPVDPRRRLTGSAWAILRQGAASGLPGGQLGGAQAGVRIVYALDRAQRLALAARASAPLAGHGAEAAVGLELRPTRLPLRLIAEQRIALDRGRGGTALYAVGGTDPVPVAAGFRLEAYAQAGVVLRDRADGFADGAARLTRAVSRGLDLGVGTWGGVQRGAARVDVGPTIGVTLPVGGRSLRLSIDWRQRIAGGARPGSGPALSIGSDF